MTEYQVRTRLLVFQISIVVVFLLFFIQLWRLQVVEGQKYQLLANANRFRSEEIEAPRGIIYDRNGNLLVRNRPVFDVVIVPAYLPDDTTASAQIFARLAQLLQLPITNSGARNIASHNAYFRSFLHHEYTRLPGRQVRSSRSRQLINTPQGIRDAVYNAPEFAPYNPVIIAQDVDPKIAAILEEDRLNLPGVFIQTRSEREYLTGALTSHILGYVGPIPPEKTERYQPPVYNPNDHVGLTGIEVSYEDQLHGIKGEEVVEVDVTGRKIKTVGEAIEAQPGNNLTLTIDLDLQTFVAQQLEAAIKESGGQSGTTVVINPQNGEILAMVSLPSYDNNLFAQGISTREYSLLSENEATPLVNKAISGLYPPGSTFKIVVSAGSLEEKTVTPEQQFFDAGTLYLPNKFYPDDLELAQPFYCWLRDGHGLVNAVSALAYSCDVYYYQVGGGYEPSGYQGLGLSNIVAYAERFGFGFPTNIDIPGEGSGLVPTERWKRLNYGETWVTGDTYNMSIGQGFVLATPLQVLNAYAALGNGGILYQPHLLKEIRNPQGELVSETQPTVLAPLNISPETTAIIHEGLEGVIEWGTAKDIINVPGISVAGKTGTAEFCERYPQCLDRDGRVKTSHAWFVAYAPAEKPEIAAVTFVYGGGEGSKTAAPVVNSIFRYYFGLDAPGETEDTKPQQTEQTIEGQFQARLLGTDIYHNGSSAAINGYVLDQNGQGLENIIVTLTGDGQVIANKSTGPTGQFDFIEIDTNLAESWQINLANYSVARPINLTLNSGVRYLVEFQETGVNHGP